MGKRKSAEDKLDDQLEAIKNDQSIKLQKPTTKGKKNMKTPFYKTTAFTVLTTIVVTLGAVFGTFVLYQYVYNKGVDDERTRQAHVKVEAAELVAELKSQK